MSISRAELEAMGRDELIETIVELSQRVEDHQRRQDALSRWKETTNDRLLDVVEANERLRAENQGLKQRLDSLEATAEQAMTIASRGQASDDRSKTAHAKHLTRNTLVVRAANDAQDKAVTIPDIQHKAEPEVDCQWQVVKNAWDQLQEEWPQFYETVSNGRKALSIRGSHVTKALARAVEHDLGRDDLTKRLVGENGGGDT